MTILEVQILLESCAVQASEHWLQNRLLSARAHHYQMPALQQDPGAEDFPNKELWE